MSFTRLWSFLAVALPVLASLIAPMSTVDLAYHLRAGSEILVTRAIPTVDSWTFTVAGQPWFDQQWGAQVVLSLVERLGGWAGLAIFRAALVGAIVGGLLVIARRRGLASRTAALVVLAAFIVMSPALALRPQLLGMACFVLLLIVLTYRRDRPTYLWFAVPIVIAWANLHGSFFLGPLALGLAWLEDVHDRVPGARRTLLVTLASVIAACLTPFGPAVWAYAAGLSSNSGVTARVSEWQPTSLRTGPGALFFVSVLAVGALLARRGRETQWTTLVWLGTFLAIGAYAERGVAWWPMAAFVAVTDLIPAAGPSTRADSPTVRRLNTLVAGAIIVVGIALLPPWRPIDPHTGAPAFLLADAPPGITRMLRETVRPGDRILNAQSWGSWFEYVFPEATVAIDSRIEIFPAKVWDEYEAVMAGTDGWSERLDSWDAGFFVIEGSGIAIRDRLVQTGWRVLFVDGDGIVLGRS